MIFPTPNPLLEDEDQQFFEQRLGQETLRNERLRAFILAIIYGALGLLMAAGLLFFGPQLDNQPQGRLRAAVFFVFCLVVALYELVMIFVYRRWRERRVRPKRRINYLFLLAEMSLPSVAVALVLLLVDEDIFTIAAGGIATQYFTFIVLAALTLDPLNCLVRGGVGVVSYGLLALLGGATVVDLTVTPLFNPFRDIVLLLLGSAAAGYITYQIKQPLLTSFQALAERNRIVDMFGQYVSPEVVNRLLAQQSEVSNEIRHVCVMFLDVRGFTKFSEQKSPEEVIQYLNRLWEMMIELVNGHNGIINKFLGDGFMAIFGAPLSDGKDSYNAIQAALAIIAAVETAVENGRIAPTRVGIGLHAGEAVTGSVGSTRRKEYTVIGDVVNLASRIEQLTKAHAAQLLVSDDVWQAAQSLEPSLAATSLGPVEIRGRVQPVEIWQLS